MSEAEANGPAETQTTAPNASDAPANVQTGATETWATGLQDGDNRAFVEKKQWKSIDDALKSHRDLEKLLGNSVRIPAEDASAEEKAAFLKKMGVPEKPEGYEFKLDTATVPQDFPYDDQSAAKFRSWAHEAGATPAQARLFHDKFVAEQVDLFKSAKEATAKQEEAAHRAIVSKWGEPTTDQYKQNLAITGRAIAELGLNEAFVAGGLIGADGAVKNAVIADAMLKVGKEMFAEGSDTAPGRATASQAKDAAEILYPS